MGCQGLLSTRSRPSWLGGAAQGEGEAIIATSLNRIDVSFDHAGRRIKRHVQMLVRIAERSQKVGLCRARC
jgi:hypothetical protein